MDESGDVNSGEKKREVFTLLKKRAFLSKFAKLLCRLDQWQHRPLGQQKMFCLIIMTAVTQRSQALPEEHWDVGGGTEMHVILDNSD